MTALPAPATPLLLPAPRLIDNVYCGDALAFLRCLPADSVDMALTSPPYDNLRTYKGYSWDFEGIARELYRVLKPGAVLVWVVGDATVNGSETLTSFRQAIYLKDIGFRVHDTMIWRKNAPGVMGKRYSHAFEYMFVFAKQEPKTFNPLLKRNKKAGAVGGGGTRHPSGWIPKANIVKEFGLLENVWDIQNGNTGSDYTGHPAVFPEELARRHIATWSNPGDLILDPFLGSGTTAKMARALGRHYIGCDISAEYVQLCMERLAVPYTPPLFTDTLPIAKEAVIQGQLL